MSTDRSLPAQAPRTRAVLEHEVQSLGAKLLSTTVERSPNELTLRPPKLGPRIACPPGSIGAMSADRQEAFLVGFWMQMSVLYGSWSKRYGVYPEPPASGLWIAAIGDFSVERVQSCLIQLARRRSPRDHGYGYLPSPVDFRELVVALTTPKPEPSIERPPPSSPTDTGRKALQGLAALLRVPANSEGEHG